MEFELLGWPADGPTLRLDHEQFAYAGKFAMSATGKAVVRDGETTVAAVAFNADRTDERVLWLRYVTVRRDRRGEGITPALVAFVRDQACDRGYDRVRIAVNNPYAFEALYRAGFGFTGETTGIAELVLEHPRPTDAESAYRTGLETFTGRDLTAEERSFVDARLQRGPPAVTDDASEES